MSTFETLQEEVGEWSIENFGDQPDVNPYIGTGEEAGELADRINLNENPNEEEIDAIGDVLVYLADFCARRGLDMQAAYDDAEHRSPTHENFFREWTAARGQLERSILKRRQGIRLDEDRVGDEAEQEAVSRIICCLQYFATERGYTLNECVQAAWYDEVIDREWDSSYTN